MRIGNIVLHQRNPSLKEIETVSGIHGNIVYLSADHEGATYPKSLPSVDPVPLTEEWLARFGFEYETIPDRVDDEGDIIKGYSHWVKGNYCLHSEGDRLVFGEMDILFVHQLQNLYFVMKGEELELKL